MDEECVICGSIEQSEQGGLCPAHTYDTPAEQAATVRAYRRVQRALAYEVLEPDNPMTVREEGRNWGLREAIALIDDLIAEAGGGE